MLPCQRWGWQRQRILQLGSLDRRTASHWASCRCSRWLAWSLFVSLASVCLCPTAITIPMERASSALAHLERQQEAS